MSLNCLTCQILQRTNSNRENERGNELGRSCCAKVGRSWSGNLSPPSNEKIGSGSMLVAAKKVKKGHCQINSSGVIGYEKGSAEPMLVRSSGMRRDWSFEDLIDRRNEKIKTEGRQFYILNP